MTGDLSPGECELLLREEIVGRLGCYAEGKIYVVPIAFAYHEGCLYGHSGPGMKIEMMQANPVVCFEVDQRKDLANWRSVIAWGVYEELSGVEAEQAVVLLTERLTPLTAGAAGRLPHPWDEQHAGATHVLHRASRHGFVFQIRITEMTGRYEQRI